MTKKSSKTFTFKKLEPGKSLTFLPEKFQRISAITWFIRQEQKKKKEMLPSCMCITINTAAKTIKTSVSCIISGCNFILIALWLRKNALDVKSEDAFPHSAALSASRHHLITHDLTVHLLSPPPPPSLPPSVSERAITTLTEYKRPLTAAFGSRVKNARPESNSDRSPHRQEES